MRLVSPSGVIATTLAIGAIAAPNAQAGGLFSTGPDPKGADQQEAQSFLRIYSHTNDSPAAVQAPASSTPNGFDYGDAAIGAGVAGGVALLITGGALGVRRHGQMRHQ